MTGIGRVDGRVRPGQYQPPLGLQLLEAGQMVGTRLQAPLQAVGTVFGVDGVQHYDFSSLTYLASQSPCAKTNASTRPMPPKSLKFTQMSVG